MTAVALSHCAPVPRSSLGPALNDQGSTSAGSSGTSTGSPTAAVSQLSCPLKTIFDKGLLVEDYRITQYCPRCGTRMTLL